MKNILDTLTQYRDILTNINGRLVKCNFDVSLDVFTLDGIDYHLICWFKHDWDNDGALYMSSQQFVTVDAVTKRWDFHESVGDREDEMLTAMYPSGEPGA